MDFYVREADVLHDVVKRGESVFLVVEAEGKFFQIKLPTYFSNPVTKEYLANYIGRTLGFPLPKGGFVRFSKEFFELLVKTYPDIKKVIDVELEGLVIFAVEWLSDTVVVDDEETLIEYIKDYVLNKEEFYSVYAFDLFLCNFDRHYKNFVITSDLYLFFIDHERSFGSSDYSLIQDYEEYSGCIYSYPQVSYLYDFINEEADFLKILEFAKIVDNFLLEEKVFEEFLAFSSKGFEFDDMDIKRSILRYFSKRIGKIKGYLEESKGDCFEI